MIGYEYEIGDLFRHIESGVLFEVEDKEECPVTHNIVWTLRALTNPTDNIGEVGNPNRGSVWQEKGWEFYDIDGYEWIAGWWNLTRLEVCLLNDKYIKFPDDIDDRVRLQCQTCFEWYGVTKTSKVQECGCGSAMVCMVSVN